MVISPFNRQKIAYLNAFSILLVLLLHSYFIEAENYYYANKIQLITGTNGMCGVAVPLFFFISGLLFFKQVNCVSDCLKGLKKRIRTLLIPYILWNCIFVGWYLLLSLIPSVSCYVNSDVLSNIKICQPLESLKFLFVEPAAFQLWFLRDLMVYMITTPVIYYLIKHYPFFTLFLLFFTLGWIPRCGIVYFYLGAVIALHLGLEKIRVFLSSTVVSLCSLLFIAKCIVAGISECRPLVMNPYFQQISCIIGIIFIWGLYDRIKIFTRVKTTGFLKLITNYSFFIFLFHEPVFNIVKKISLLLYGVSECSLIINYFINPLIMVFLSIGVAAMLKNSIPRVYGIMVGGR